MASSRNWLVAGTTAIAVCSMLACGCTTTKTTGDEELPEAEVLTGEYPQGKAWNDPGNRIKDVKFDNVLFLFDSAQLLKEERAKIEAVAVYLRKNAGVRLVLEGNCDERGSRDYNIALGERRALAVRAYLIGLGIDVPRLATKSFGEEDPVDPGHSESAWRVNRRVEFALYR